MPDRDARGRKDRFEMQIVPATIDDAPAILDLQKLAYHTEAILYHDWSIPPLTQTLAELRAEFTDWKILKASQGNRIIGSVRAIERKGICCLPGTGVRATFGYMLLRRTTFALCDRECGQGPR